MIRMCLEIKKDNPMSAPKTYIKCPQCLNIDWFYNFIPMVCKKCGFEWGNVNCLHRDVANRRRFYINGEI